MKTKTGYVCKIKVLIEEMRLNAPGINAGIIAEEIKVSQATLSGIANNKKLGEFDTTYRICKYFRKNIDEIWIPCEKE